MSTSPTQADRGFVYAVARRIVRDDDLAQDLAQEALLLAHRHRDRFRGDASYRTWLYRIATSVALSALRRRRTVRRTLDALGAETAVAPPPVAAPADEAIDDQRTRARLAAELAALAPGYRQVLELRLAEDRSEREIAADLGLSLATVKIRVYRARHMLRDRLGGAAVNSGCAAR